MDAMTKKIRDAALDMLKKIEYTDSDHSYRRRSDNKLMAGTTSISGMLPKGWLAPWGAKEAVKFLGYEDEGVTSRLEMILGRIKAMDAVGFLKLLSEAKGAHARKNSDAKDYGHEMHEWLEKYVKARIRKEDLPAVPEGEMERPLKQFTEWESKNVDEWILSEAKVIDEQHEYCGTVDAVARLKDGRLVIIDFKSANFCSDEYNLQLAGYANCFENHGIRFDSRLIVRLPKTLTKQEYDKSTRKYLTVPNDIEVKEIITNYDFDKRTFLALREVFRWTNYAKNI